MNWLRAAKGMTMPLSLTAWGQGAALIGLAVLAAIGPVHRRARVAGGEPAPHRPVPQIDRFGLEGFRLMFQRKGLRPRSDRPDRWLSEPRETVLVFTGDTTKAAALASRVLTFRRQGGSVLIATDLGDTELVGPYGITLFRGPIQVAGENAYQGLSDCPVITSFDRDHPLFKNVEQLVANRSGFLVTPSRAAGRYQCAWFPNRSRPLHGPDFRTRSLVVAMPGRGRLLVVADHSLFVNEMLMHGDNAIFAWNCVNWLCGYNEDRKYVIFVEDGLVVPSLLPGGAPSPPVSMSQLLDALRQSPGDMPIPAPKLTDSSLRSVANRFVTSLEDKDVFNQALARRPRGVSPWVLKQWVLLGAATLAAAMFIRWLLVARGKPPPRLQVTQPVPMTQRRVDDCVRTGRFERCARDLAREFFSQELNTPPVADWQPRRRPQAITDLTLRQRLVIRRRVRQLWKLATQHNRRRIGRRKFDRFVAGLDRLHSLRSCGRLRLQWPSTA